MYRRKLEDTSLWVGKKGATNPAIPPPEKREVITSEVLTEVSQIPGETELHEHAAHIAMDARLQELKPYLPIREPKYNVLYSTMRSEGDWRYCIDNYASGQLTTVAGQTVQTPVTMQIALDNKRMMQWPGSTQMFLCIRAFSIAPIVKNLATVVGLTCIFQDISGMGVPLLATESDTPQNTQNVILFPSPITDTGILTVGSLLVKLETTGTTATYDYMLAFSYAYMIAADTPYERSMQTKGGPIHVPGTEATNRNPLT